MPSVISYLRDDAPASCETRVFAFGVVLIAIGGTFAFLTLGIAYALALGSVFDGRLGLVPSRTGAVAMIVSFLLLTTAAVLFIWTGIGSVRLRRWCRPIVMCLSALAAAGGLLFLLDLALQRYFLPDAAPALVRRPTPGGLPSGVSGPTTEYTAVVLTTFAFLGIILPVVFFLAYRSRKVERTLDEADPNLYWTDRSDMPTLAFALLLLHGAYLLVLLLPAALTSAHTVVLGHALGPVSAATFILLGAPLCVMVAHLVHMQSRIGPWLAIVVTLAAGASVISHARAEPPATPNYPRYGIYGPTAEDKTLSTILTVTVYATPAILFALWVLRLRQPPARQPRPKKVLPRAIVLDMPVAPLPLEPPLPAEAPQLTEWLHDAGHSR